MYLLLESSYASIISHRIGQRKFLGLNVELWSLPISLSFWLRLILRFVFKCHHTPKGPDVYPQQLVS